MKIVHISDLHFGEELVRNKVEKAIKQINEIEPDLVVVTGDLSCWGIHSELREAYEALEKLKVDYFVVPGNHDARNNGIEFFELYFGERKKIYKDSEVVIIGVDSTQPDIDDGYIGFEQRRWIGENVKKDRINVLALHHHIVPIPDTGRERNVLIDAGEVVEMLINLGFALVLAGHRHMPYSIRLMRTHIIHAGSLGSFKILGMPDHNYNIIELSEENVSLKLKFVDYGEIDIGKYQIKTEAPESVAIYRKIGRPKRVLFVSKNGDARVQMAEALFNKLSPYNMLAEGAGVYEVKDEDRIAREMLNEIGVEMIWRKRKIDERDLKNFDYIVEFDELGFGEVWKVELPKSREDYKRVREEIKRKVDELINQLIAM